MTSVEDLMAVGMPAGQAKRIGLEDASTGLTATGTTQATALALTSTCSIFGTVGASSGCVCMGDKDSFIYNGGGSTLSVYPPVGSNINGTTVNTAFSVPAGKGALFKPTRSVPPVTGATICAIVSA